MAILTTTLPATKRCWRCRTTKPVSDFYRNASRPDGLTHQCKPCNQAITKVWRDKNPERNKVTQNKAMRKHRWGDDYDEWVAAHLVIQDNACAICKGEFGDRVPFIDHDHKCCPGKRSCGACRRGLLCNPCNSGIGLLGDDVERLRSALRYLEGGQ